MLIILDCASVSFPTNTTACAILNSVVGFAVCFLALRCPRLLSDAVSFHDVLACVVLCRLSLFVVICFLDQLSQLIVLVVD